MTVKIFTALILLVSAVNVSSQQDSMFYPTDLMITVEKTKYVKLKPQDTVYSPQKEIVDIDDIHSVAFFNYDSLTIQYETGRKIYKPGKWYDIFTKKDKSNYEKEIVFRSFHMDKVTGARIKTGSFALLGTGAGLVVGAALGYLFGDFISNSPIWSVSAKNNTVIISTVLGAATGAMFGWLIGSKIKLYEHLKFSDTDNINKKTKLIQFIRQNE